MHKTPSRFALASAIFLLTSPTLVLAQTSTQSSTQPGATPADQAFHASMKQMDHAMSSAHMTGNTDQDFVAMMLPHHMAAVAMAKTELQYGKDPTLRKMAQKIITSQDAQITEMQNWQRAHPVSE